jgi:pyruvate,water dikinase
MKQLLSLDEAASRPLAGGKGHGLHLLRAWGLNVPPAYVVSTAAYRAAITSPQVAAATDRLRDARPGEVAQAAADTQRLLLEMPLHPALSAELGQAWEKIAATSSGRASVSCRSSATIEDSGSDSFAGQFATVLGVSGQAEIERAVRHCWASVWSPEAVGYCRARGIDPLSASMAVVVQRMVRADVSGVAFSVNPVTGGSGEAMINASWGLGETVVSGLVTPDTFLVSKTSLEIIAADISQSKTVRHVLTDDGKVEEQAVDPVTAISASLSDAQVAEVAALAVHCERKAGSPQDVEWAFEDGRLYVLQTRPVTTR